MQAFLTPRLFSSIADGGRAKDWDAHVEHMEALAASPAFRALRDRVISLARLSGDEHVLDVGAGTGLLTLAAAVRVSHVSALDISSAMCARLRQKLSSEGIDNVNVLTASATALPLADDSIDAVISNYCLHHLDDAAKREALNEFARVLRPGGRLVIADMMFDLGLGDRRNRAVMVLLIRRVLGHGIAGFVRLCKNAARIATGRWERPATADWWRDALHGAGFTAVSVEALEHEGGVASACAPLVAPGVLRQRPQPGEPTTRDTRVSDTSPPAAGRVAQDGL